METWFPWTVSIGLVLDLGMTLEGRKQRSKHQDIEDMSARLPLQSFPKVEPQHRNLFAKTSFCDPLTLGKPLSIKLPFENFCRATPHGNLKPSVQQE